jgi:hypothetical protein
MNLIQELLALNESRYDDEDDAPKSFAPIAEKDAFILCKDDADDARSMKRISIDKLTEKDNGKDAYVLTSTGFDEYALVKVKFTKISVRKGDPKDSMVQYRYDKITGSAKAYNTDKKLGSGDFYIDSSSFGGSYHEVDVVEAFIEKMNKKHKDDFDFKNIDPKIAKEAVAKLNLDKVSRKFDLDGKTWNVSASVSASDKYVLLAVLHTPEGGGNIKHGNRMEIFYMPSGEGVFKRHFGSFDVPRSPQAWMNLKTEVTEKEMADEIKKAFKLAKTKDADAYHREFSK